ncbi:MAG TPA: CYTH and CHAD domain-containing protein [Acidimicrobiales bacterium]|nr:CYTH and CHAD domain-containing protein [Acidimicrobiales bacterium]
MTSPPLGTATRMGNNSVLEQEVKLDAPIGLALPDLRDLVGRTVRLPQERLATTYYDTVDRRLWRQGLTLRHRLTGDGGEGMWTLKVPHASDGQALERTEVSWNAPGSTVPAGATDVLRGVIRREPLRELVELDTRRQRLVLRNDNDTAVAELDDDLVHVVGGGHDGERFRQVELELLDDTWRSDEVLRRLEEAGARVQNDPKLARAVDLPDRSPRPSSTIDRASSVADVVQASLQAGVSRLVAHDWRIRLAAADPGPEDVHQARVATRRLRSDLKTFGSVLDPVWVHHVRDDLKWVGTALGDVRDADVLADHLADAPLALHERLATQRAAACQRLAGVMADNRYVDLLDKLHAGADRLPVGTAAAQVARQRARRVVPGMVKPAWRGVRRQVKKAGAHPTAAELHQVRIKSKQLRYAAELATPVIGPPARRTASAAERVQTVLGDHHDAVAAEAWLRAELGQISPQETPAVSSTTATAAPPATALEAGLLVAEARRRERKARRQWKEAWKKLARPKRRRWLSHH